MVEPLLLRTLANGVILEISDATCHYYGGYYHVRLEVTATVAPAGGEELFCMRRTLERMGVRQEDIYMAREELLASFTRTMLPYIESELFPDRLVVRERAKACKLSRGGRIWE